MTQTFVPLMKYLVFATNGVDLGCDTRLAAAETSEASAGILRRDLSKAWYWLGIKLLIRAKSGDDRKFLSYTSTASYVKLPKQPWAITFTAVTFLLLSLGFGPVGVAAGSVAAAFQGCAYGAFTPAGGIFATLTSFAMLGLLMPADVSSVLIQQRHQPDLCHMRSS
ncbi:hypothetical protein BST61_g11444 [Cercospora zeina]